MLKEAPHAVAVLHHRGNTAVTLHASGLSELRSPRIYIELTTQCKSLQNLAIRRGDLRLGSTFILFI